MNKIWTEKYRPKTLANCILPKSISTKLLQFVEKQSCPNLIFAGNAGMGKTTAAKALVKELNGDYYVINGSLKGNIDTLRTEIKDFASTMSLGGSRKYVILDEADYLNPQSTQPALRNFMEEYSSNCGFILTCNYLNKIISPLQSRCSLLNFAFPADEKPSLMKHFFERICWILEKESVKYSKAHIIEIMNRYYPDFRKTLNEIQVYVSTNVENSVVFSDEQLTKLVSYLKERDFLSVRRWVGENSDVSNELIFRHFYDKLNSLFMDSDIPSVVALLGEYQYKNAFVADKEINVSAFFAELMLNIEEWKA